MKKMKRVVVYMKNIWSDIKNINKTWYYLHIKNKLIVLTLLPLLLMGMLAASAVFRFDMYVEAFKDILNDYYGVSQLIDISKQNQVNLANHINTGSEETIPHLKASLEKTKKILKEIKKSTFTVKRKALLTGTETAIKQYIAGVETLGAGDAKKGGKEAYIAKYYEVYAIGEYITKYSEELLQTSLYEGNLLYDETVRTIKGEKRNIIVLIIWMIGVSILIGVYLARQISRPIIRLSDSAKEIGRGNFQTADIVLENKDEIGELATVLNAMKKKMSAMIIGLEEKAELEKQLLTAELEGLESKKREDETRMLALQSQIAPHFLFNTLNTISRTARGEDAEKTEQLINSLSSLFRYNLYTEHSVVTLERELRIIKEFMHIQQSRFGDRVSFYVDCAVAPQLVSVPTFTLQPLVENAFKHGIEAKAKGGSIRIKIRKNEKQQLIIIKITDTGRGMDKEVLREVRERLCKENIKKSIGLKNVYTRLQMVCKDSTFCIYSKKNIGTCIKITIPYEKGAFDV